MLQFFFIHQIALVTPFLGHVQEDPPSYNVDFDDGDSLPSLDDLSIGSGLSDHSIGDMSHEELCQLLGPKIVADDQKHCLPTDMKRPKNLENAMVMNLDVGYYRLRKAFLSDKNNDFWEKNVLSDTLKYKNIVSFGWDRHQDAIGLPSLPAIVNSNDIIGCTRKTEYLMPKTAVVKANKAFETTTITEYNDHCFAMEMKTNNPDVPFGKYFVAHTKIVVYNTGENTCKMHCSVETEFPQGPPPLGVGRQIKAAMKAGSFEVFEKIADAIIDCSHGN